MDGIDEPQRLQSEEIRELYEYTSATRQGLVSWLLENDENPVVLSSIDIDSQGVYLISSIKGMWMAAVVVNTFPTVVSMVSKDEEKGYMEILGKCLRDMLRSAHEVAIDDGYEDSFQSFLADVNTYIYEEDQNVSS